MDHNQLDGASSELDEVTRRRPQLATPHLLLGYVHHRRRDLPAAEQAFRAALKRSGEGRERIAAHLGLGAVLEQTERQAEADGQYAAAIAMAPELREVLIEIQKQHLLPQPVAVETDRGEVSPSARLREMEKILRKMDEQK
jgi:Flp pilus assembly protein TadD